MFLVRKISHSKWDRCNNEKHGLGRDEISADAVTADLRTSSNQVSFWKCNSDELDKVREIALAIVAGSDRIETIVVVLVPVSDLKDDGLDWNTSEGRTPVQDLSKLHVDVCHLDYERLGKLARHVRQAVDGQRYERVSKKQLIDLVAEAAARGRLNVSELRPKVKKYCSD